MAGYNKVILMGNLTRDPELKTLPSQTVVCDFALAVNRRWKDASGEDREEVLFIDCAAFGKQGETFATYLRKGRPVHVEGRLKLDRWEDNEGRRHSKIRVIVEQFRFVGSAKADANAPGKTGPRAAVQENRNIEMRPPKRRGGRKAAIAAAAPAPGPQGPGADTGEQFKNDDIPF